MVKNLPANAGDAGSITGLGRSPGEGNINPLQYACLGNPMDRGAWQATVHEVTRIRDNLVSKHLWERARVGWFGRMTCIVSHVKRITSPGLMQDTGSLGLVHWDDPE